MANTGKRRILLVDDDEKLLKMYATALQGVGIDCDTAADGVRAQNMTRVKTYDIIVTDLAMPCLHGHKLLTELIDTAYPAVLIALTGVIEPRLVRDLLSRGVAQILLKPLDPAVFAAIVQGLLDRGPSAARPARADGSEEVSERIQRATDALRNQLRDVTAAFEETISNLEERHNKLEDRLLGSIRLMSRLVGEAANDEGSHASRVEQLSMAIARRAGLGIERIRVLRAAALLHELGQFGLPDNVRVASPWELRGRELEAYHKYPEIGATLLSEVEGTEEVVAIVDAHCENYDGSGFPRSLRGDAIPLEARILRIADGIDTLRMHRPSENLLDDLKRHLNAESGKAYEPHLAKLASAVAAEEYAQRVDGTARGVAVEQLRPGMTLARDLYSAEDHLLARGGAVITSSMVERLKRLIPGRTVQVEAEK